MQDSGIFTAESLVISPEPPQHQTDVRCSTSASGPMPSPGNSQQGVVLGKSSISLASGVTTITIVCSTDATQNCSSNAQSSSECLSSSPAPSSRSRSIVTSSNSSSSLSSHDDDDVLSSPSVHISAIPSHVLPRGRLVEGNTTRGRIVKKTKKPRDDG